MTCPICKKPTAPSYRPFCSRRCADIDLGKWLTGSYAVPADSPDDFDDAARDLQDPPTKPH
ncbi:DNA gyrase inhibitor YacG [Rhodovulum tesquicola]|uniref:DNA gyrase inhibitor YacG n=1 Tax=Rhodovulum tesquicola TaxID=540254 RepID=UPI002096B403|nr:DNA gyrase inhibitor YacG [Rhodovulum tesquicola]MCO8146630.1 DNA gyrase inhibitor YacG [Rhodovulum tesquicola]